MHTPAPWNVNWQRATINGVTKYWILEANDFKESEANAKLIAAAPELLDALKEIIEYLDCGDDQRNLDAAVELGRAAIEKAMHG